MDPHARRPSINLRAHQPSLDMLKYVFGQLSFKLYASQPSRSQPPVNYESVDQLTSYSLNHEPIVMNTFVLFDTSNK